MEMFLLEFVCNHEKPIILLKASKKILSVE